MEADDLSLVERAKAGEADAFRALVVRYQRKVYAVALGIVKDPDLAWDVAQESFVRVHEHLGQFEGKSAFSTWLFRISTHLSIDAVRRERTSQKEDVDEVNEADLFEGGEGILATALGNDPRENVLRRELAQRLEAALATLPEKHRTILVLREVEGLSYEELAERLGIQKGTVMSRLFHARHKMQAALADYVEERSSPRPSFPSPQPSPPAHAVGEEGKPGRAAGEEGKPGRAAREGGKPGRAAAQRGNARSPAGEVDPDATGEE